MKYKKITIYDIYGDKLIESCKYQSILKLLEDNKNNLRNANLYNANLYNANLYNADLRNANLYNANLYNADLHNANLYNANLHNADLRNANLYNANLHNADLRNANLYNADLRNANLYNANLYNADLHNADLRKANLYNANLHNADLRNADLRNANLYNADLRNANLYNADLRNAKLLFSFKRKIVSNKFLMDRMFKSTKNGLYWICYKSFNENYSLPEKWDIKRNKIIKNRIDINRWETCSYGINVGTLDWCKANCVNNIYKLYIPKTAEICVPYYTDGKVRVSEAKIVGVIK